LSEIKTTKATNKFFYLILFIMRQFITLFFSLVEDGDSADMEDPDAVFK